MESDGGRRGRSEEPTSYGLRPPLPAAREPQHGAPAGAGAGGEEGARAPAAGAGGEEGNRAPEAGAGRLVGGRYRLLERLGAGGMGTVWRARDEVVDRDVALKEPRVPDHFTAAERHTAYQRMQREARAAARIDHPSVVAIHDVVTEGDSPWIVMELLRGKSLAELLDEGTLSPQEAARIGLAVLGALTAAHEAGVLHRDVKPGNVMVCRHDRVVLTDFGIAHMEGEQKLTETGAFVGSPEYIAPERVLGRRPGPESDLWSLGVTLYQAVEGVSPFRRQTTPSTLQAVLLAELPPPQHSAELTAVLTGLLRKEPENRISAPAALPVLRAAAHPPTRTPGPDAAPGGHPDGTAARPPRDPLKRRLLRPLPLAGGVVLLAALLVALVLPFRGGDDLPEGWKRYEEYRMRVTLAAPADWSITTADDVDSSDGAYLATRYTSPKGDASLLVDKKERTTETALATAQRWKQEYETDSPPEGGSAAVATVAPTTEQGRDAAVLTVTYSKDEDGAPRRLSKTLVVVNSRQERLTLNVDVPAGKSARATADGLLDRARAEYRIGDL
ncbi:serine/threonine-protein kinase [Streptomyces ficellus]|uniref:non-specific serine/threonine protein kinase n=1 Tax=Streptomyces ficellus TaxID=1977088 RepID=A0A6I6FF82_9ACTN|nr:serine/threonine-protein kinase [Streptomyces ficellus]QGV82310.1 serine/threonine protein kinase [Streptomyces ficellus]